MNPRKKILLILDIDETLIHASYSDLAIPHDFMVDSIFVYKRPFLDSFFEQIQDDFIFAVWTSSTEQYANHILKSIIPDFIKLEFVWSRKRCVMKRDLTMDFGHDPDTYEYTKPLKKVKNQGYDIKKMLIVDDTPFKCFQNYGNAIYISSFEGDKSDNELLLLANYLKMLKDVSNVRHIEKRHWRKQIIQQ